MTRLISLITLITFAWTTVVHAFPYNPDGYMRTKYTHASVSNHTSGGDFTSKALDMQHLFAPRIKAKKVVIHGADGIRVYEVHDCLEFESHSKTDDGVFGGKSEEHRQSASAKSKGMNIEAEHVELSSLNDIELTNVNIKASKTIIKSMDGIIKLLMGTNYYMSSMTEKNSSALWQGQGYRTEQRNTFSNCQISGDVELDARRGVLIQSVQGKVIEYLDQIKMVNGELNFDYVEELYKIEEDYKDGPTAALAIIIAIAASICTMGAGAALSGAMVSAGMVTAGGTAAGAVTVLGGAAISSLASQAAVSLVANKGDFGKAAKSLSNSSTLKNIGIAMAAAGISSYVGEQLGVAQTGAQATEMAEQMSAIDLAKGLGDTAHAHLFSNHLAYHGLKVGVDAGIGLIVDGRIDVAHCARVLAASVTGALLATHIGKAYGAENPAERIDAFTHKVLHTTAGAFAGVILDESGNPLKGAAAGALGAFVAETFADMFKPEKPTLHNIHEKECELGRSLNKTEFDAFYQAEMNVYNTSVNRTHDFAKLTAATTALFAGQDVAIAASTSTTALDNNFLVLAYAGIAVGSVAWEAYDVYHTYQNEGPAAALIKLGVDAALFTAGGYLIKGGSIALNKAVTAILSRNPLLAKAMGGLVETMVTQAKNVSGKVMSTKVGQTVNAGVNRAEQSILKGFDAAKQKFGMRAGDVEVSGAKASNNVKYVDEKSSMSTNARYYNDSAPGARSNVQTKCGQAPSLEFTTGEGVKK